jgi:hypothetical protein
MVSDSSDSMRERKINNLVEMVFRIYIELCEYDEVIIYFNSNNIERDDEVTLYLLLSLLLDIILKNSG